MSSHSRAGPLLPRRGYPVPLTTHNELALPAHGGRCIAGDACIVAIVLEGDAGDLQGAHELLALDGHARARDDHLPVFPPRDADGHVPRGYHTGDVEQLANGGRWELEGLDERGHWEGKRGAAVRPPCAPAWLAARPPLPGLLAPPNPVWAANRVPWALVPVLLYMYIYAESLGCSDVIPWLPSPCLPGPGICSLSRAWAGLHSS